MAIQLTKEDFARLVAILSQHGEWQTVRGRLDFLTDVFAGSSREQDILTQLNLDGTPRGTAVQVVQRLQAFGQDHPGRETLGVLINKLTSYLGASEDVDFLQDLLSRYPFETQPLAVRGINGWRGNETGNELAEKIIGENTLRDICLLEVLIETSSAVIRISGPSGVGTGFLVGENLVITNHHVLPTNEDARKSLFEFNYQLGRDGKCLPTQSAKPTASGAFYTSPMAPQNALDGTLDYTILELENVPKTAVPIKIKPARVKAKDRVIIIQHPSGSYKKFSIQNNFVEYADEFVVQYTTSTEPGSSGSPVLDSNCNLVAVHHAGGMLCEPATRRRYLRNEGISIGAILNDLHQNASGIYNRLG